MSYIQFIGIDVSKEWFDVALDGAKAAKPQRFQNGSEGFAAFAGSFAAQLPHALVVLESTGGYETALISFLLASHVAVHRAHPLTAKHFIRSLRLRAKTDALDAMALARYGAERQAELRLCTIADASHEELSALLARRADLVAMRVSERNRLQHPSYASMKNSVKAVIKTLDKQILALETRMETLVATSQLLSARRDVLTQVKGVGRQTAVTLLACMPELGTLTRRQAASLAGCAPHPRDSGNSKGYRRTVGGRAHVRRVLFMAAMAARNFHPELRMFYQRLTANGKKPMVALTAVMRKLITILNAKIRDAQLA